MSESQRNIPIGDKIFSTAVTAGLSILKPEIYREVKASKKREYWATSRLEVFQLKQLKQLVSHAYANVPFYTRKFDEAGIAPSDIRSLSDITKIPLTNTTDLQQAIESGEGIAKNFKKEDLTFYPTTGSTGTPFKFPLDKKAEDKRRAYQLRNIAWYGHVPGMSNARLWRATAKASLKTYIEQSLIGRRLELTIYDKDSPGKSFLSEKNLSDFVVKLRAFQPLFIDGYVSALTMLATYMIDNTITDIRPHAVVTGAEYLSEHARAVIEKAFSCPVLNRYGGTEIGFMAHECGEHPEHMLHINADRMILEILKDNQSVAPGESGEVVVTDFTSYATPFIRFQVKDVAVAATKEDVCPCGRKLPMLKKVEGRINDIFQLPDGSYLSSHVWHNLFRDQVWILEFQVVQHDLSYVEVKIVPRAEVLKDEYADLQEKLQSFLPGVVVKWNILAQIEPGPGGKFRHSISHVPLALNQGREDIMPAANRIRHLKPYTPPDTYEKVAKNPKSLKLDWNEGESFSPAVRKALMETVQVGYFQRYPDPQSKDLRKVIAHHHGISADWIRVFNGSDSAIEAILQSYITYKDTVIMRRPEYEQTRLAAEIVGGELVRVDFAPPFTLTAASMANHIDGATRLVYLSNPHNPSGVVWEPSDIEALAKATRAGMVVVDEAYMDFINSSSSTDLVKKYSNIIVTKTLSKAHGLAGLRVGYTITDPKNYEVIDRVRNSKQMNVFAGAAAIAALLDKEWLSNHVDQNEKVRTFFAKELRNLGFQVFPSAANFVLASHKKSNEIVKHLSENNVYVRTFPDSKAMEDCMRITLSNMSDMKRVISLLSLLL